MLISVVASILLHIPILIALLMMENLDTKTASNSLSQSKKVQLLQSLADLNKSELTEKIEDTKAEEKTKLEYQETEAINETTEKLDTNLFGAHTTKAASTEQQQLLGTDITQVGIDRPYKETLSTPLILPQEAQPDTQQTSLLDTVDPSKPVQTINDAIDNKATTKSSELLTESFTNPDKSLTIDTVKPEEPPKPEAKLTEALQESLETQLPTPQTPQTPLTLPNQQTQLTGQSNIANQSSLEVNKSQLGEYGKQMSNLVEASWQKYNLENRQYIDPGFLRIRFKVNANGFTSDFEIVEVQGCNDVQKSVTIEAIKYCQLPPIPQDLIQELGADFFFVSYTFYY